MSTTNMTLYGIDQKTFKIIIVKSAMDAITEFKSAIQKCQFLASNLSDNEINVLIDAVQKNHF
jgi:uncharacterized membrane-anchored protein YjiN (DUF445 family)